jgi:UDPglucose--hexose-1-phosphate uridylyltransferase
MGQMKELTAGVVRNDRKLADGRTIRYYDTKGQTRKAEDTRPPEDQPLIGELRLDPLVNEWVAFASHRQSRIFLPPKELCPLCPTVDSRLTEIPESDFEVVVFDNRFPSLRPPAAKWSLPAMIGPATPKAPAAGVCEIVCFTPEHGQSFCDLSEGLVRTILEAWRDRTAELSQLDFISQVFPFENRGEEVGVTLTHPHGQIYAYSYLPPRTQQMLATATDYFGKTGGILFDDLLAREIEDEIRIVARNAHWIAFVPFAARYPFEIHVAPLSPVADLTELSTLACDAFPEIAREVLRRLDGVFNIPMAYMAAWHQAPVREGRKLLRLHWQITSVRRAPGKLKYLAGSESAMGAFIMDMLPEQSANQLRGVVLKK